MYCGQFKNGDPDGNGVYKFADGTKFCGEFKESNINGVGIKT